MVSEETLKKIEEFANQIANQEGCKVYDVEFGSGAGGRVLRVYIDKDNESVSLEDCSNVSRGLNQILDESDLIPGGQYHLEVSSPGLERPLKKNWHFEAAVGKKVKIKLSRKLEAYGAQEKVNKTLKQVIEVLQTCEPTGIRLEVNKENILIPFSGIERANVFFDFNSEKGEKRKKN